MATAIARRKDQTDAGSGHSARLAIRAGAHRGPTAGLAPGNVQGNLAILPQALAADFLRFCQLNPKPCPLIGLPRRATRACRRWARISTSAPILPRYRVWRNGELVAEPDRRRASTGATTSSAS